MDFTLDQLKTFFWVARLASFKAAARQQNLSQPTISARILELERILDTRLFDRTHHTVELTLAGRDVLSRAEKMLRLGDELAAVGKRTDPMKGVLRLGASESAGLSGLTSIHAWIVANYPDLQVELTIDVGATLSKKLNAKELDMAILAAPNSAAHVTDVRIGKTLFAWVASAKTASIDRAYHPGEIAALPVITVAPPSIMFDTAQSWFSGNGVMFERYNVCNSLMLMSELVAETKAVAITAPAIVKDALAQGRIHILKTTAPLDQPGFYISYLRELECPEVREIIAMAKQTFLDRKLILAE